MSLSFADICWAIIAISLVLALLFGWDLTS
jgi:hypothetical protein